MEVKVVISFFYSVCCLIDWCFVVWYCWIFGLLGWGICWICGVMIFGGCVFCVLFWLCCWSVFCGVECGCDVLDWWEIVVLVGGSWNWVGESIIVWLGCGMWECFWWLWCWWMFVVICEFVWCYWIVFVLFWYCFLLVSLEDFYFDIGD